MGILNNKFDPGMEGIDGYGYVNLGDNLVTTSTRTTYGTENEPKTLAYKRPDMDGPDGLDDIIKTMNLEPDKLPDLDNISQLVGDTDRKSGITLNL